MNTLSSTNKLEIKGFQGTTLLDFPGFVASILFTGGCDLRCPYCHNRCLVEEADSIETIAQQELFDELKTRVGFIDGLVITGGEPLMHEGIFDFIAALREQLPELAIKIDTNGSFPDRLKKLIDEKLVEHIALDVKTAPSLYPELLNTSCESIQQSIKLLSQSTQSREFRTTTYRPFMSKNLVHEFAQLVSGKEIIYLQRSTMDPLLLTEAIDYIEDFNTHDITAILRGYPKN